MAFTTLTIVYAASFAVFVTAMHVAHPMQSQLPLVARAGASYSWAIRNDTFQPAPSSFSAFDLPPWLSFDDKTLAFSGTVPANAPDGKMAPINVHASDDDGSAKDSVVLYVSSLPAPVLAKPLAGQLRPNTPPLASVFLLHSGSALGDAATGLRVPPGWSFSIGWDGDTFTFPDGSDVLYAATLANGDPLPDWVTYDPDMMNFAGVAPNLPDPTHFDVVLYGGDLGGYQAVHDTFSLIVAAQELSFDPANTRAFNISANSPFNTTLLVPGLLINGAPMNSSAGVELKVSDVPSWAAFAPSTLILSGSPPAGYTGTNTIVVTASAAGQTVHTNMPLAVVSSLFENSSLPPLVVPPQGSVSVDLAPFLSSGGTDTTLSVDAPAWLTLDKDGRTLVGNAPDSATSFDVHVSAKDGTTGATSRADMSVTVSSTIPPTTPKPPAASHSGTHGSKINKSVLAACLGALIGFVVLCTFAACCRKFCSARDDAIDVDRSGALEAGYVDVPSSLKKKLQRVLSNESVLPAGLPFTLDTDIPPHTEKIDGLPSPTVRAVADALPTRSVRSAFFRGLVDYKNSAAAERKLRMRVRVEDGEGSVPVRLAVFPGDSDNDLAGPQHHLNVAELERSGSGSAKSCSTVDTFSTMSEPLEVENETPRRRPGFGPRKQPPPSAPQPSESISDVEIRTAARVAVSTPRRITVDSTEFQATTPEIVQTSVRLVSSRAVVEEVPQLPLGRGAAPAMTVPARAFTRMTGDGRELPRASALSYLSASSVDEDSDEHPAIADARRALAMGRGTIR